MVGTAQKQLLCRNHARAEDVQRDAVPLLPVVHRGGHLVVHVALDGALLVAPHPHQNLQLLNLRDATLQFDVGQCILGYAANDFSATAIRALNLRNC